MPDHTFDWRLHPETEAFVSTLLQQATTASAFLASIAKSMLSQTGTRLADWVDHFELPLNDGDLEKVGKLGYEPFTPARTDPQSSSDRAGWRHTGGLFPNISASSGKSRTVFLKVDSVRDFLFAHGFNIESIHLQGLPGADYRTASIDEESEWQVGVAERHGYDGFCQSQVSVDNVALREVHEQLLLRRRSFPQVERAFEALDDLLTDCIERIGRNRTCDVFFNAERRYWQQRNQAAQLQYARQNQLGLGWANHDHHTYRSSRRSFHRLVQILEKLGFECRERFYAGEEAGWGAQVLEQTECRLVVFADVDLSEQEVEGDFAHEPLGDRDQLGTVGLWCGLHGEAIFEAGMHHLECQFDFERAGELSKDGGVPVMNPFTDFPFLKQAFTQGERWSVSEDKLTRLIEAELISNEQAERFRNEGAIGSHLEILMRNEGYKGFNQTGVSDIIRKTDPRR